MDAHITFYCRQDVTGTIVSARAYKSLKNSKDITPACQHFVYSNKAKRYVVANFYILNWQGKQLMQVLPSYQIMRSALIRIGMDMR